MMNFRVILYLTLSYVSFLILAIAIACLQLLSSLMLCCLHQARKLQQLLPQCEEVARSTHRQLLEALRGRAEETEEPNWTLEDLDRALQGEPDKGQGVDRLQRGDLRRLPAEGRHQIVDLQRVREEAGLAVAAAVRGGDAGPEAEQGR